MVVGGLLWVVMSIAATQAQAMSWMAVNSAAASPLVASAGPTVTGLKPTEGPPIGGIKVLIKGTHLTGATAVDFDSSSASFTVKSAGEMFATAPPGEGTVDVTVTTPDGTSPVSTGDQFHYVATPPVVEELVPNSGPEKGSDKILIKGHGFTGATAVDFGSADAVSFTVNSPTSITAFDPAGAGTVNVTVTTPEGTSAITAADEFTYTALRAKVEGISPKTVAAAGGATVTVRGKHFFEATEIEFGGVPATSFTATENSITAVVPAEQVGKALVTVTTPVGESEFKECAGHVPCLVILQFAHPTITGVSPSSGSAGTTVTVTGSGFAIGSTESLFVFGTAHATSVSCASTMECTVVAPVHSAGKVQVRESVKGTNITTPTSPADEFTYN